MKIVIMIILIACAGFSGYWLYKKHVEFNQVAVRDSGQHSYEKTLRSTHTNSEEYKNFKEFLLQKKPSAIIIIIKKNTKHTNICNNGSERHRIIITNNKNPEIKLLERWSIDATRISTPYSIILHKGDLVIRTFGIICDY